MRNGQRGPLPGPAARPAPGDAADEPAAGSLHRTRFEEYGYAMVVADGMGGKGSRRGCQPSRHRDAGASGRSLRQVEAPRGSTAIAQEIMERARAVLPARRQCARTRRAPVAPGRSADDADGVFERRPRSVLRARRPFARVSVPHRRLDAADARPHARRERAIRRARRSWTCTSARATCSTSSPTRSAMRRPRAANRHRTVLAHRRRRVLRVHQRPDRCGRRGRSLSRCWRTACIAGRHNARRWSLWRIAAGGEDDVTVARGAATTSRSTRGDLAMSATDDVRDATVRLREDRRGRSRRTS